MKFTIRTLICVTAVVAVFACGWSVGMRRTSVSDSTVSPRPDIWTDDPVDLVSMGIVEFRPDHFQTDISENISIRGHRAAIGLLVVAQIDELIERSPGVYYALEGNWENGQMPLPGVTGDFVQGRDWIIPEGGRSDSLLWMQLSELFATKYNQRVLELDEGNTGMTTQKKGEEKIGKADKAFGRHGN